jgi:hypothetical protein
LLWGEPGRPLVLGVGEILPQHPNLRLRRAPSELSLRIPEMGQGGYFGAKSGPIRIDVRAAGVKASCCWVNLAVRWFWGLGSLSFLSRGLGDHLRRWPVVGQFELTHYPLVGFAAYRLFSATILLCSGVIA